MRSGNGRHRRPRQAPAIVVTAGVTGAGIALPLFGAAGAHAADAETWDRVAQCESGGMWSADTGNGYYGGLQFALQTWNDYGGRDFAPRPDLASRSEQIVIAERVLEAEGANKAWPSCALKSGLALESIIPDEDPDRTQSPESESDPGSGSETPETGTSDSSHQSDPSEDASSDTDPTGAADGGAGAHGADRREESGTPATTGSLTPEPGTGRHRGEPAPEDQADDGQAGGRHESGRHASRGGDADRTQPADGRYVVRPGDNLSEIAQQQDLTGGWPALYASNKDLIGSDPDLILPGQRLVLDGSQQ